MRRRPRRHLLMDRTLGVCILAAITFAVSYPLCSRFIP